MPWTVAWTGGKRAEHQRHREVPWEALIIAKIRNAEMDDFARQDAVLRIDQNFLYGTGAIR